MSSEDSRFLAFSCQSHTELFFLSACTSVLRSLLLGSVYLCWMHRISLPNCVKCLIISSICLLQISVHLFHSPIQKVMHRVGSNVGNIQFSLFLSTLAMKTWENWDVVLQPSQKFGTELKSCMKVFTPGKVCAPKSHENVKMRDNHGKCFKLPTEWPLLAICIITLGNKLLCFMTAAIIKCQSWSLQDLTTD